MARKLFSAEELEELRLADEELDKSFVQTKEEIIASRLRDRDILADRMDNKSRKIAENQRAYREANREKINAYMREYLRRHRRSVAAE